MIPYRISRPLRRVLALAIVLVATTAVVSAPSMAQAATPHPGKPLTAEPTLFHPGGQLPALRPNTPSTTPTFRMVDYATGRCLDSNYNGDVYTLPCNGGPYQLWWIGPGEVLCDYQTGRCIEALGSEIRSYFPSGDLSQLWTFLYRMIGNIKVYHLANDQYTNLCLDSNSAGVVNANPCNDGQYQEWYFA